MHIPRFILSIVLVMLAGCVSAPEIKKNTNSASQLLYQQHLQSIAAIHQFTIQGRVGVQTEGKGYSASLNWQHSLNNDDISLYTPLGGQVANIKRTVDKTILEDANGNSITAETVEDLTQSALGWRLPLAGLADWALGRATNRPIQSISWDEHGFLSSLKQDGWDIQYQNYIDNNGVFLPRKILLKSEKINLKLLVEKWNNFSD